MICQINISNIEKKGNRISTLSGSWAEYDVDINGYFDIFAMGVYRGCMHVLLDLSGNDRPIWYDLSDFIVTDSSVDQNWQDASFKDGDWTFLFGYKQLLSDAHFNGLLEREEEDILIFRKIKKQYNNSEV